MDLNLYLQKEKYTETFEKEYDITIPRPRGITLMSGKQIKKYFEDHNEELDFSKIKQTKKYWLLHTRTGALNDTCSRSSDYCPKNEAYQDVWCYYHHPGQVKLKEISITYGDDCWDRTYRNWVVPKKEDK